jgi:hypothetical protein
MRAGSIISSAVLAVGLAMAPVASGHFSTGQYTHESPDCSTAAIDPITMVFTNAGTEINAKAHIAHHTTWLGTTASGQMFKTHMTNPPICAMNSVYDQLASGGNPRWHVRMQQTYDSSPTYGTTTIATPHLEWSCGGGHRIQQSPSGFIEGRTHLGNALTPQHAQVAFGNWGNNLFMYQSCGGYSVRSDGWVVYLSVP